MILFYFIANFFFINVILVFANTKTSFHILFVSSCVPRIFCLHFYPLNLFVNIWKRKALRKTSSSPVFMKRGKLMFYLWRAKKEFIMLKNELMIHFIYHNMCLHYIVVLGRSFSFKFLYPFMLSWLSQTSRSCVI